MAPRQEVLLAVKLTRQTQYAPPAALPVRDAFSTLLRIAVVLTLGNLHGSLGAEPDSRRDTAAKYRELVQRLVSPNKEPIVKYGSGSAVELPPDYDVAAQRRIEEARQVLHDNLEAALPFLIEALDDKRYCMTIVWAEEHYYNWSVGKICRHIIESQLEIYRRAMSFGNPPHWHKYDYSPISREWWEARKGRTLVDLQIEAVEWAIDLREVEGSDRIREKELGKLRALRDHIAKTRQPAPSLRMYRMVTHNRGTIR